MFVKEKRRDSIDLGNVPTQTAELGYEIMKAVARYDRSDHAQQAKGKSTHHYNVEVYGELMAIAQRWYEDRVSTYESTREEHNGAIW